MSKVKPLLKKIFLFFCWILLAIIVFLLAIEFNLFYLFGYSPSISEIKKPQVSLVTEIYTSDSVLIGKFFKENRTNVTFDELPKSLIDALIATEDARFFDHAGVDLKSIFSIVYYNAKGENRGGSTITQQLAKNLFRTRYRSSQGIISFVPGLRVVVAKFKEWNTALKIEYVYSKNEIITLYLNTVNFGNNAYGIGTASKTYFSKDVSNLTIAESALLIGLLKAPSTYNPFKSEEKALERRNVVLGQMLKYEKISQNEFENLSSKKVKLLSYNASESVENASYIRDAVSRSLKEWSKTNDFNLYADGLKIYTTIDSRLQSHAEEAVNEQMKNLQQKFYRHWDDENPWRDENDKEISGFIENLASRMPAYKALVKKYKNNSDSIYAELGKPKKMKVFTWKGEKDTTFSSLDSLKYYASILHSGLITLDPFTGKIKAWVGDINYNYFQFDHVQQAKRQPGSTFKPFAYGAALENGFSPCDKITDKAVTINYTENGEKKQWSPKNSDWNFTGYDMTLRWGMARSVNSVTAQLTEKIGWDNVVKYAHKLGITSPLQSVPSICLGVSDVSLYEMVGAYGSFLNKGNRNEPFLVQRIDDQDGKTLAVFEPKSTRVISEENAWLMLYMFKGGIEEPGGTSQALWEYDLWKKGNEIGGKTGTTSNHSDGWFFGFSKDLVTGVWVGADERSVHFRTSQLGEGSKTALPIYGKYMEKVYADPKSGIKEGRFPKPTAKIMKEYYCTNRMPARKDSSSLDSLIVNEELPLPELP